MKTVAKAQKKAPAARKVTKARPKMAKTGKRG
jgi:hypothetical protein